MAEKNPTSGSSEKRGSGSQKPSDQSRPREKAGQRHAETFTNKPKPPPPTTGDMGPMKKNKGK